MPIPSTQEELKRRDQGMRYAGLFSHLEADERSAREAEASGNLQLAAAWRGHFYKMSGLTEEQVEIVKKIGQEFILQRDVRQQAYNSALLAARSAPHAERPSRHNTPALADAEDSIRSLMPETIAKLVSALGSRTFSQLDSYTIHMFDNSRVLTLSGGSKSGQSSDAQQTGPNEQGARP